MNLLKGPYHLMALLGWLHLMIFALLWDGGQDTTPAMWVWVAIKLAVLAALLPGIARANNKTMQLASMLVLLYMAEGSVRGFTGAATSAHFGWAQFVLAWITFFGLILHLRPIKQAAKRAKAEREQTSHE